MHGRHTPLPHPVVTRVVDRTDPLDPALIADALDGLADPLRHAELERRVPALQAIEAGGSVEPGALAAKDRLRVVAWNMERCKYVAESVALVRTYGADVVLATEMDLGMARSGNRHTLADMAAGLGGAYVYGVEFAELGLGDRRETVWHAGEANNHGYHGNGIVAAGPLAHPALVRLDDGGVWFGGAGKPEQRRLGFRQAMVARLDGWKVPVWLVSAHLESRSDPSLRDEQIARLVDALDGVVGDEPVILGGDLNTVAVPHAGAAEIGAVFGRMGEIEPLFERMERAGYLWREVNTSDPTMRARPDGTPVAPFPRIDWLFCRGLTPVDPVTIPAVDSSGSAISDHEAVGADFLFP